MARTIFKSLGKLHQVQLNIILAEGAITHGCVMRNEKMETFQPLSAANDFLADCQLPRQRLLRQQLFDSKASLLTI